MSDSPFVLDVTEQNFRQVVLEGSMRVPVLVDFWAQWCQPCKALMPLLAKLAEEYGGRFILAKVNTEEARALATQFGIRSIPTVKLFKSGQAVDEFAGALPESQIRTFLDKHIPRLSDRYVAQARQMLMQGDSEGALQLLQSAQLEDPANHNIPITLAQTLGSLGDVAGALEILDALPEDIRKQEAVARLRDQLFFEAKAATFPPAPELLDVLAADEKNLEARYQLAFHQVAGQDYQGAMDNLLTVLRLDRGWNQGAARQALFSIFELLGNDPLVARYRSKLMSLMH